MTSDTPDTTKSADDVLKYYRDGGKVFTGIIALGLAAILFMFFASALRKHLRATGPEWLSTLAFAGHVIFVVGMTGFATSQFSLASAADEKNLQVMQALNYIDNNSFPPVVIGLAVANLAIAWHVLSSKSLPAWIGWVTLVLGIVALAGPIGFIAFVAIMPWTLAVSIVLYRRGPVAAPATA